VECLAVPNDTLGLAAHPVCQFTSPNVLEVTVRRRTFSYRPGVGQPATLVVRGTDVHCIMASNFTLATLRAAGLPD